MRDQTMRPRRSRRRPRWVVPVLSATLAVVLLAAGCALLGSASDTVQPASTEPWAHEVDYPGTRVISDVQYGTADDGTALYLDVCLPEEPAGDPAAVKPRASIIEIHGGSWARGDKSNVHYVNVCQWLASEGYVTISINYRLAPASIFPAAIEDARDAVRWLRDDTQVEQYNLDPELVGAFGGSAGANLAALLAVEGSGDLDTGTRVAAVAELSGPIDLTAQGRMLGGLTTTFEQVQLDYLGCRTLTNCPQAEDASPLYDIDETDPPFFVGHSTNELIPLEQSEAFVAKLRDNGIATEFVTVEGPLHSIAMLDGDLRERIADFYAAELTSEIPGVVP